MTYTIKLRRGLSTDWTSVNPTLSEGEPGVELDTNYVKIGDGSTPWNSLEYTIGPGTGLPDAVGLPDGKMLATLDGEWVIVDAPETGLTSQTIETEFVATAGQTVFVLPSEPVAGTLRVYRNGLLQALSHWSKIGLDVTLSDACAADEIIKLVQDGPTGTVVPEEHEHDYAAIVHTHDDLADDDHSHAYSPLDHTHVGASAGLVKDARWYNPDSTPHAMDREFRDIGDLDSAIRVDNSVNPAQALARTTWTQAADSLTVFGDGTLGHVDAAGEMHGFVWPYALAVGEAIQTHIVPNGIQQAYAWAGLVATDSVAFGSGTQMAWLHWHATNLEGDMQFGKWTGWNTRAVFTDSYRVMTMGAPSMHWRLLRDTGDVWRYYASTDARHWTLIGSITQALTPTHVGFAQGMWGAAGKHAFHFDYLRVVTP